MPYINYTLEDSEGRQTKRSVEIAEQATLVDYESAVTAFSSALAAVTDLACVKVSYEIHTDDTFAGETVSNVDEGATFVAELDTTPMRKAVHRLPDPIDAARDGQGNINLANTDIAAYLALWTSGSTYKLAYNDVDAWVKGTLDK
jgi:hypothetical protein